MTSKPSLTNCPKLSCGSQGGYTVSFRQALHFCLSLLYVTLYAPVEVLPIEGERRGGPNSGGYSGGVPPLPIPNREVKPARADGTAHPWVSR